MTNEELWKKIGSCFDVVVVLLLATVFLCAIILGFTVKADTLSFQTWNTPQLRYEKQGYFIEAGQDSSQEVYSLGKSWTFKNVFAELGMGWHEIELKQAPDDDLFVFGGVGVEYSFKNLILGLGYRVTNVNVDDDKGDSGSLNGPLVRIGGVW